MLISLKPSFLKITYLTPYNTVYLQHKQIYKSIIPAVQHSDVISQGLLIQYIQSTVLTGLFYKHICFLILGRQL